MILTNESGITDLIQTLLENQARMEARIYYLQCTVNAYVGLQDNPTEAELQQCLESL